MAADAYPLAWPAYRPRTEHWKREKAAFDATFARARDDIIREIRLLLDVGRHYAPNIVISTNVSLRRDGMPLAGQRAPEDPGVAVYFTYHKREQCFACDRWTRIEDNLRAISKTIEALRGIARWGTGDMMEAAFAGFVALPAPGASSTMSWWQELGILESASAIAIEDAYRRLRFIHHPDRSPSADAARFHAINSAYQQAQALGRV